ncbi:MAG: hypothetical protein IKC47_01640 [Clostridia bacterium]|nr:hypothetical protein [Clostridia bacterium]
MKDNKTKQITRWAVMLAVIFVAMMLDKAISIALPVSMAACVLLATFTFCFLDNSWGSGVLAGAFFGIASLCKEFIFPSAMFEANVNPLISVLPRVVATTVAFAVYRLVLLVTTKMSNAKARQVLSMAIGVLFGLVANTLLYLTALGIYKNASGLANDGLFAVIYAVLFTNIIPEYLISLLAVPTIVLGVRRGLKLGVLGNNWKTKE